MDTIVWVFIGLNFLFNMMVQTPAPPKRPPPQPPEQSIVVPQEEIVESKDK